MATIVYVSIPAHGHVNPTLPVVAELVRRGHRVIYYILGESFRAPLERAGAEVVMLSPGPGYDPDRPDPNILRPGPHLTAFLLEATLGLLPPFLRDMERIAPDVIVHDMLSSWGRLAAGICRIPSVCASVMFTYNRTVRPRLGLGFLAMIPLTCMGAMVRHWRAARQLRQRYGARNLDFLSVMTNPGDLNLVFTSRAFQPCGDAFDDTYRFVGPSFAESAEVGDFPIERLDGPGAIYVSMGTLYKQTEGFYRTCIEAFKDLGRPVVMAIFGNHVEAGRLGEVPPNFVIRPYVPQLEVLKRTALFLSHGGMNSVNQSLWLGRPMLLVPQMIEQRHVSAQVASLGAGLVLGRGERNARVLRQKALQVLEDPRFAARADAVGESLRTAGGYRRAADEILAFIRRRKAAACATPSPLAVGAP
jgi:MGT family glycosyltransferase